MLLTLTQQMLQADNHKLYYLDLLVVGAVKRALSLSAGFSLLVRSWNLVAAYALVRMHLDTLMRLSGATLVSNPHDYAKNILEGKPINKMKSENNQQLTDKYLVGELGKQYEWMPRVYQRASGFVHLSGKHIYSALERKNSNTKEFSICIGPDDHLMYPRKHFREAVDCFNEISKVFMEYVQLWISTKDGKTGNS